MLAFDHDMERFVYFVTFSENKTWRFAYEGGYLLFYGDPHEPYELVAGAFDKWFSNPQRFDLSAAHVEEFYGKLRLNRVKQKRVHSRLRGRQGSSRVSSQAIVEF